MSGIRLVTVLFILTIISISIPGGHAETTPPKGLFFNYAELTSINNGKGNYTGFYCKYWVNGTETVSQIFSNGNISMNYNYSCAVRSVNYNYFNSRMGAGNFTFSTITCAYTNGTDNETGYINPHIWFYTNPSIKLNSNKEILNTEMKVASVDYNYYPGNSNKNISTIFLTASGTYVRDDSYGVFNASYTWNAYYDKSTGFIVAYVYSEVDSNGQGDGFTCTNTLYVKSSSYGVNISPVTASPEKGSSFPFMDMAFAALFVFAIIVILAMSINRRNKNNIKRHSNTGGEVRMTQNPDDGNKKEIHLDPKSSGTEQVVIKEIVKVKCQYCGALIDSTLAKCPVCGAPRS